MDSKAFGNFIANRRKELGLTQLQLANTLMVTDRAVSKWERGVSYPDITLIPEIAEALGTTVGELMSSQMLPVLSDSETKKVRQAPVYLGRRCVAGILAGAVFAPIALQTISPEDSAFFYAIMVPIGVAVSLLLGLWGLWLRESMIAGFSFGFSATIIMFVLDGVFLNQTLGAIPAIISISVLPPTLVCMLLSMGGYGAGYLLKKRNESLSRKRAST